jgi:hypothetical protein
LEGASGRGFAAFASRGGGVLGIPEIEFSPGNWSPIVEGFLQQIDGIKRHINALQIGVENGDMQALLIRSNGAPAGVLIWSIENDQAGAVVIANAVAGSIKGVDLTVVALNFLTEAGRAVGAVGVRCWTQRKGLVRKCEALGMRSSYVIEGSI